jgi:hypothetical protein
MASGDVIEAIGSDNSGNVVVFVASNTDANANPLPNGGLFVTYVGVAGACTGVTGTDVPFRKIPRRGAPIVRRTPIPRHPPVRRFGTERFFRRARPPVRNTVRPVVQRDEIRDPQR